MPPRTRGTKGTKIQKENLVAVDKSKSKTIGKIGKPPRKALADKTNSASDDNTSLEIKKKVNQKHVDGTEIENMPRPCRERRLPTRYVGNNVLKNLSNSKEQLTKERDDCKLTKLQSPAKVNTSIESPFKTPQRDQENSLVVSRPKRICRLPSKFEDHSISPSKFIPLKPCHASTPILENKSSKVTQKVNKIKEKKLDPADNPVVPVTKNVAQKRHMEHSPEASSDTNNNAKRRFMRRRNTEQETVNTNEKVSPRMTKKVPISRKVKVSPKIPRKIPENNFSYRVLEDKRKSSQNSKKGDLDVYEFTYDPTEEPPPAKKKRKRTVKKKPAQPKTVVFKNNYDQNVAKALAVLKNAVTKKPDALQVINPTALPTAAEQVASKEQQNNNNIEKDINVQKLPQNTAQTPIETPQAVNKSTTASKPVNVTNPVELQNYNSVRVEDIAADFEIDDYNDINYSPVNSPQRPKTPVSNQILEHSVHNNDPLNLQGDLSFFDNPVASSSMNMSARHPQASPWRVEFNNLPIKWQANTYIKPNMTPAVESSFINSEETRKKHVYTNMVDHNDPPEVVQNQSNLKQTSIIDFIREVVEKSAQKKKRGRSVTPVKANNNNLFDDLQKGTSNRSKATPKKVDDKSSEQGENVPNSTEKSENDKENLNERNKKKTKTSKDKDGTFFGFDDSEDQENVSPVKIDNPRLRALRPRSRAVLQEINAMSGPMRALPLAAKSKIAASSDAVNKVYEEMKSAADAPVIPEKNCMQKSGDGTLVDEGTSNVDMCEDSNSVHLFEDIELIHHLKPTRKSYGKAKKVTFRQHSTSSETQDIEREQDHASSEEDDLADLTFTMPTFQPQKKAKKKKTKKQKMSKKEQQALEEWAAGFNSMCEDIEDVPLIVE